MSKHTAKYWRSRLTDKSGTLYFRPTINGHREWISLDTGNSDIASKHAAEKYLFIKSNGWKAFRKPRVEVSGILTVGKFLEVAEGKLVGERIVKPNTFRNNSDRLLKFVKWIEGIPTYAGKDFDRKKSQAAKDRALNTPLDVLSKESIEAYKVAYLESHHNASNKGATTFNSDLRSASSLFKADVTELLDIGNPFAGIKKVKVSTTVFRYKSKFDLARLMAHAENEAKRDEKFQPVFECLAFAAGTGCRKEEMDRARWSDIDLENRRFILEGDHLKTDGSAGTVTIMKSIAERLRAFRSREPDAVFVIQGRDEEPTAGRIKSYRCNVIFRKLMQWLRDYEDENGFKPFAEVNKPLHTIRKEVGSLLYKETGNINAVKAYLRHTQLATTIAYYVDDSDQEAPTINF